MNNITQSMNNSIQQYCHSARFIIKKFITKQTKNTLKVYRLLTVDQNMTLLPTTY